MATSAPTRRIAGSTGWHVTEWCHTNVRQTKDRWAGQPLTFEAWQAEFIDELFLEWDDGSRVYNEALLGIPRKNGKSTIVSGLGLYLLANTPGEPEIVVAAGSKEQAGAVFTQAKNSVKSSPNLQGVMVPMQTAVTCPATNGSLKRISTDNQHGLNPSAVITDELHEWDKPRHRELFAALTTADGARTNPLTIHITTAGFDKETILGELYDNALATCVIERRGKLLIARNREAGFLMYWYGLEEHDDVEDLEVVKASNPASWITTEYLHKQRDKPTMKPLTFERLHGNRWTEARESFISRERWAELKAPPDLAALIATPHRARVAYGADAAITSDTSAVGMAWRVGDRIAVKAHVWSANDKAVAHEYPPGDRFALSTIDAYVVESVSNGFDVGGFAYDPAFLEEVADRLDRAGLNVVELTQASAEMAKAWQQFYAAVKEGRIIHDGDPVLTSHVAASDAVEGPRGWVVRKRTRSRKIDGLVSVVAAHWLLLKLPDKSKRSWRPL